jgi:DNA-binding XRE family transcriptional regulator/phage-related protein
MGSEGMQVVFFRGAGRLQPVQQFLEELERPERRAAADSQVDRLGALSTDDPPLPPPWDEQVEAELRALRIRVGRESFRVLYRRSGTLFVLLHAFEERGQAIPEDEIRIARRNNARSKVVRRSGVRGLDTPIGLSLEAHIAAAELDDEYRRARARLAPFEQVARLLIRYRMDHGLSQTQLAERAGISHSVVSRIETGQHRTNLETLGKIALGLGRRLAISFLPPP